MYIYWLKFVYNFQIFKKNSNILLTSYPKYIKAHIYVCFIPQSYPDIVKSVNNIQKL